MGEPLLPYPTLHRTFIDYEKQLDFGYEQIQHIAICRSTS